jgi:HAD superfamily hydrolase (TIGR01549 family)
MSLLVLIDLDDTLLGNVSEHFLPAYVGSLCKHISGVPAEKVVRELEKAIWLMEEKKDPSSTLEAVFDRSFYPGIGIPRMDLQATLDDFYQNVFPGLKKYTLYTPKAKDLISDLFDEGCEVAIATNPLFPRTATLQRLEWAGLPLVHYPFKMVTTYESYHFAKPQPAYFAEILAQLGWEYSNVVMIGDRWDRDILPASRLGLPTFWIQNHKAQNSKDDAIHPSSSRGELGDVMPWIKKLDKNQGQVQYNHCSSLMAVLSSTPAALDALSTSLTPDEERFRPSKDEWSIVEIICHLRDADKEVNIPRFESLLDESDIFLSGVDTDPWVKERSYQKEECQNALSEYELYRSKLLRLVHSLPENLWERTLRHSIFGPTKPAELVGFVATHDRSHVQQVYKNLCKVRQGFN